jgi:hypothetical protein
MRNPLKPDRPAQDRDNPVVPNVVERPVERAADRVERAADRAAMHDNPTVPNAIERPVERAVAGDTGHIDLFPSEELAGYRTQWESIQTGFVDRPRAAVEQADALVSQLVTRLTDVFARERSTLEGQWTKGDNVSTEDLRIALTRYRSFFNRLLSM